MSVWHACGTCCTCTGQAVLVTRKGTAELRKRAAGQFIRHGSRRAKWRCAGMKRAQVQDTGLGRELTDGRAEGSVFFGAETDEGVSTVR